MVIPVGTGHARFLPHALKSVWGQTMRGAVAETIVVNDTGKPLTPAGVRVMETRGREGSSRARNMGLDRVRTPFVVFLDADDMLVNTAVETMLRAYATYGDASYIYGDAWYQPPDRGAWYYAAPLYDRHRLLTTDNIHNITTLLPTEVAQAVGGFDEEVRGWEDWDFYIRLGIAGYCGTRVPSPFILYQQHTGINRSTHWQIRDELIREERERYADYIEGRKGLMGCCGGKPQLVKTLIDTLPPESEPTGDVLLEYTGLNAGSIAYRVNGNVYRGANNREEKIVKAKRGDVDQLVSIGVWRRVPLSAQGAQKPVPGDVIQARKREDPPGITIPRMESSQELAASVSILKPCANCGHIKNFDSPEGCQALLPSGKVCGCLKFVEVAERKEVKANADGGRAHPRKRANTRNSRAVPATD